MAVSKCTSPQWVALFSDSWCQIGKAKMQTLFLAMTLSTIIWYAGGMPYGC